MIPAWILFVFIPTSLENIIVNLFWVFLWTMGPLMTKAPRALESGNAAWLSGQSHFTERQETSGLAWGCTTLVPFHLCLKEELRELCILPCPTSL